MVVPATPLDSMASDGIVPLYSSGDPDELYAAAVALAAAGISTFEVTLRAPGSLDALRDLLARSTAEDLPLAIGAGTVLDPVSAEAAIAAGARFIFSPVVSAEVAGACRESGVPHIPGCATPTEIHAALELGCSTVKLFPADALGGPGFLRAVRSVFPQTKYIPSGGLTPKAAVLREWFGAGAAAVAMGSQLFGSGRPGSDGSLLHSIQTAVAAVAAARAEVRS